MLFSFFCCPNNIWMMSEWCLNDVSIMFGCCLNDVWTMSGWCPAVIFIHFHAFVVFCYLEWSLNDVWMCLDDVWMMSEWCLNHGWMMSCCHFDPVKIFLLSKCCCPIASCSSPDPPARRLWISTGQIFLFFWGSPPNWVPKTAKMDQWIIALFSENLILFLSQSPPPALGESVRLGKS